MTGPRFATAAEVVAQRADDDHRGLLFEGSRVVVAAGGRRVGTTRATASRSAHRRPVPCGRPPREHARVPLPAGRCGTGRGGHRRDQPHPARRGVGLRHHQDRLPAVDHRFDPTGSGGPSRSGHRPQPGAGRRRRRLSRSSRRPRRARPSLGDAGSTGSGRPVPAHLHLRVDRWTQGGPDDPGPRRPRRHRHGVHQ